MPSVLTFQLLRFNRRLLPLILSCAPKPPKHSKLAYQHLNVFYIGLNPSSSLQSFHKSPRSWKVIFVFQEVPTEEGLILVVVLRCFKSKSSSIVFPALHKG